MEMSTQVSGAPASSSSVPSPLRIGAVTVEPPLLQAPMAKFTNFAFRQILRQYGGVGLTATEMVSARSFLELDSRGKSYPERLWGVEGEPRPLAVQIWDNDPAALADVGRRLVDEFSVSVIDINFGCPVRRVACNAESGSYLLRYPDRVGEIVERVAKACRPTPVTAKIRLGPSEEMVNAGEVAEAVEAAGGAAITVHGRTAKQMFRGQADWERIAAVKEHLRDIPLIGNGDLRTPEAVAEAFRRWPIDGVMIGRAMLGRPWLFAQAAAALAGKPIPPPPSLDQQKAQLIEHHEAVVSQFGVRKGTVMMRRFACCYAQGCPGARVFRDKVARVSTAEQFAQVVQDHFPKRPEEELR
jgi:tRNA-dihydrouridine synthase B